MFVHIFSLPFSGVLQIKYAGDTEIPLQNSEYIEMHNLQQYNFDPKLKPMFSTCLFSTKLKIGKKIKTFPIFKKAYE